MGRVRAGYWEGAGASGGGGGTGRGGGTHPPAHPTHLVDLYILEIGLVKYES